mmetsp:Transcript_160368/g.510374  ORF Transcript_160368/g.510374 Transcript_160368/m.510374 type:complete len:218 (+) Transcript_160368:3-656(+)
MRSDVRHDANSTRIQALHGNSCLALLHVGAVLLQQDPLAALPQLEVAALSPRAFQAHHAGTPPLAWSAAAAHCARRVVTHGPPRSCSSLQAPGLFTSRPAESQTAPWSLWTRASTFSMVPRLSCLICSLCSQAAAVAKCNWMVSAETRCLAVLASNSAASLESCSCRPSSSKLVGRAFSFELSPMRSSWYSALAPSFCSVRSLSFMTSKGNAASSCW